jgi:hypothetical protein
VDENLSPAIGIGRTMRPMAEAEAEGLLFLASYRLELISRNSILHLVSNSGVSQLHAASQQRATWQISQSSAVLARRPGSTKLSFQRSKMPSRRPLKIMRNGSTLETMTLPPLR